MSNEQLLTTGSTWHIKLPGAKTVDTVKVTGLTAKTVTFENQLAVFGIISDDPRYLISDIKWVECTQYVEPVDGVRPEVVNLIA